MLLSGQHANHRGYSLGNSMVYSDQTYLDDIHDVIRRANSTSNQGLRILYCGNRVSFDPGGLVP